MHRFHGFSFLTILLVLVIVPPMAALSHGELLFYDSFDGEPGQPVLGVGEWQQVEASPRVWVFGDGSLAVPPGVNLASPSGRKMVYQSDIENYSTGNIQRLGYVFERIGTAANPRGVVYMSYLQFHEHSNLRPSQNEWAGVELQSQNTAGMSRPNIFSGKDSGSTDRYRLETASNGNNASFGGFTDLEVRFLVTKIEWDLRTEDENGNPLTPWAIGQMWVNPNALLDEAGNLADRKISVNLLAGTSRWGGVADGQSLLTATGFDRVTFNAGSWGTPPDHNHKIVAYDEFRLGTTWAAVTPGKAQAPVITPDGGSFQDTVEVSIVSPTAGASVRYTTDGSAVTGESPLYTGPFVLNQTATVRARSFKEGIETSDETVAEFLDQPQVATPVIAPDGGDYTGQVEVSIGGATPGAVIRYTTDGTEPVADSPAYDAPFTLTQSSTVNAKGFKDGFADSALASQTYTLHVAVPVIEPNGGEFVNSVEVALSCPTPGAAIHYTTDGSEPTAESPLYSAPVTLTESATVTARAFKDGLEPSAIVTSEPFVLTFSQTAATPVITPDGGAFDGPVQVTITSTTPEATIRYTVSGLDPGPGATPYTGPLTLPGDIVVKARAFAEHHNPSGVAEAAFEVDESGPKTMTAATYYDKLKACWIAQMVGNFTGLPHEGSYRAPYPPVDGGKWHGTEEDWINRGKFRTDGGVTNAQNERVWRADDDTDIEWVMLNIMEDYDFDAVSYGQIRQGWIAHINRRIWVANARARQLMGEGVLPPQTGMQGTNQYFGAIDAQLEIEIHAQIAPGMPLNAKHRVDFWARVTNDRYAVDCAKFYGLMQADAFFINDPNMLVERAKRHFDPDPYGVPKQSVHYIATMVQQWYNEYPNWVDAVREVHRPENFHAGWTHSYNNFALGLVALLYGEGDLAKTIKIACLAGYDADNQAATIGAIVGTIRGWQAIENLDLNEDGTLLKDAIPMPSNGLDYHNWHSGQLVRDNLPEWEQVFRRDDVPSRDPDDNICSRIQAIAEENIVRRGGSVVGEGDDKVYTIVDGPFFPNYDPKASKPIVAASPQSATAKDGDTVTLHAIVHGTYPMQLQWRRNGEDIPDAEGLTFTVEASAGDSGAAYTLYATNIHGAATTDAATVTAYVPGDFSGDGVLSGLDIPGFKQALADPDGWALANPGRPHPNTLGDFNGDGVFSGLDIPGFKQALAGQ